jgi:hypothetical protein
MIPCVSTDMFETFLGLPLHPLVIHAAVVLVPLLIVVAFGYALVPGLRARLGWVAVVLAVLAPLSTLLAKLSGDAFRARLARIQPGAPFPKIDAHRALGTATLYWTIGLALLVFVLVLVRRRPGWLSVVLAVAVLGVGLATGYYVYRAGDTAAHIVWTGY